MRRKLMTIVLLNVVAGCFLMASTADTAGDFRDPITEFPWLETFGTDSSDWMPEGFTQRQGLFPNPSENTAQWEQKNWLNGDIHENKAANINIYGAFRQGWLITPAIDLSAGDYELNFDLAFMDWDTNDPPRGTQEDDRFLVIVSSNALMNTPVVLREWNNTGSEWVLNDIPTYGDNVTISLRGMSGVVYLAFYGESTVTANGDNDLMIDNLEIREEPVDNADDFQAPATDLLLTNYPNPFHAQTTIHYELKESQPVKIEIYNLKGQLVRVLVDESKPGGRHEVFWDGKDQAGNRVGSGCYYYKMQKGKYSSTGKMILLK
ncbi:MAG: FlgD immunoglobulin-like domain containing protein [Candidatus Cloacimonadaceae bacterium]|jgi:hypothetical protein|nr:T9SS type A sorting domain-containing protein [Candidatus Cloacimonadota bacterium]MCK9243617.1 T9SS type A sorting domain-containing protein [Candidatus Cloacimonadota bacterium]MDD3103770.1 FlgD immunoglobulin-like domain containing protein [Candidatus Cloacimonadota bacterium]MDD3533917.1 FlgD immunoglobulin-like domain containing protein [Candidatus Cloacimonadota bacterium]MDY0128339.1 FlgD immunoglobulin-like domain containing protein [Candidatus Cloacimonadaceae bacterium]